MPDEQPIVVSKRDSSAEGPSPEIVAGNGRAEIAALADELLPALIARLSTSSLGELEVREGPWRVRLRLGPRTPGTGDGAAPVTRSRSGHRGAHGSVSTTESIDGTPAPGASAGAGRPATVASQRETGRLTATSPAVGYFAPRDGAGVGQPVRSGDVLGHIDVLGVRQEVVSPADGIVSRLLAEAGEAVEYGQELIRLERVGKGGRPAAGVPSETAPAGVGAVPAQAALQVGASSNDAGAPEPTTSPATHETADETGTLVAASRAAPDVATS